MRPQQMNRYDLEQEVLRLRLKARAHKKGLRDMNKALERVRKENLLLKTQIDLRLSSPTIVDEIMGFFQIEAK